MIGQESSGHAMSVDSDKLSIFMFAIDQQRELAFSA